MLCLEQIPSSDGCPHGNGDRIDGLPETCQELERKGIDYARHGMTRAARRIEYVLRAHGFDDAAQHIKDALDYGRGPEGLLP